MYRQTNKASKKHIKSYTNRKKDIPQQEGFVGPRNIPELRRVIEITDYDCGVPVTHKLELFKTARIDSYKVVVDGRLWKKRIGWSNILAGIRKALPRLLRE